MGTPGFWNPRQSLRGHSYATWEPPMPRIPDHYLDTAIYLYASHADAEAGIRTGGSGFLVSVPIEQIPGRAVHYAVTNAHVVEGGGCTVRLNTTDGKFDIYDFDERHWIIPDSKDDIAICQIPGLSAAHRFCTVPTKFFASREIIDRYAIGPGDDTFVVGRFINAEGRQQNLPSIRFGNLAQMPWEPIEQDRIFGRFKQESYLVEARSISGFSGSPVFVLMEPILARPNGARLEGGMIFLLGIVWGYVLDWGPVCDQRGKPVDTKLKVCVNTGMMGVVPAWKLEELLNRSDMTKLRKQAVEQYLRYQPLPTTALTSSDNPQISDDQNPQHLEDFTRLVDVAARKRPQDDQT